MAGKKAAKVVQEPQAEEDSEAEYEVEAIRKHKRKGNDLQYYVSWVGYPSEVDGNDCWVSEESVEGAQEMVNKYWKSLPVTKQSERYPPGSARAVAAKVAATSRRESKSAEKEAPSAKKGRQSSVKDEASTSGSATKKRSRKEESPELSAKKGARKTAAKKADVAVEPQEEEKEEDVAMAEEQSDEKPKGDYSVDGHVYRDHHEKTYAKEQNWESYVRLINTVEKGEDGQLKLFVVWDVDGSFAWVNTNLVRRKCPQKLIDFYETHLSFTTAPDSEEDAAEET